MCRKSTSRALTHKLVTTRRSWAPRCPQICRRGHPKSCSYCVASEPPSHNAAFGVHGVSRVWRSLRWVLAVALCCVRDGHRWGHRTRPACADGTWHTPEHPGPACTHPQTGACWMRAMRQRRDERQVHKYKLAWGICLRICNKFLLQCSCDIFFFKLLNGHGYDCPKLLWMLVADVGVETE